MAGAAIDELGPRNVVPIAGVMVGIGAFLFATGDSNVAAIGRFLQGAGAVFAPVGAIYIATTFFPASQAATLIGATQMFGMSGGSVGQFAVGPAMRAGLSWRGFWMGMGLAGLMMGVSAVGSVAQENHDHSPELAEISRLRHLPRLQESPVYFVWVDCRDAVYSDDHLRHDLGDSLPARGTRF